MRLGNSLQLAFTSIFATHLAHTSSIGTASDYECRFYRMLQTRSALGFFMSACDMQALRDRTQDLQGRAKDAKDF
jgi:hypothetical protein